MATLIVYILYLVQVLIVTKKLFGISYEFSLWKLFFLLNLPVLLSVFFKLFMPEMFGYVLGVVVLVLISIYVFIMLNKKMDLVAVLKTKILKKKNNE